MAKAQEDNKIRGLTDMTNYKGIPIKYYIFLLLEHDDRKKLYMERCSSKNVLTTEQYELLATLSKGQNAGFIATSSRRIINAITRGNVITDESLTKMIDSIKDCHVEQEYIKTQTESLLESFGLSKINIEFVSKLVLLVQGNNKIVINSTSLKDVLASKLNPTEIGIRLNNKEIVSILESLEVKITKMGDKQRNYTFEYMYKKSED